MGIIVLHGISAIEAWDIGACAHARPVERLDLGRCASSSAELGERADALPSLARPLHIAVPDAGSRRKSSRWMPHVLSRDLPRNSFFRISEDVYVEAPYLCFALLASTLSHPLACMLGMELCGGYSSLALHAMAHRTEPGKGYLERPPLTSVAQIGRYCDALELGRRSQARRACKQIAAQARSPRESILHLLAHMPPERGGYGLRGYELNCRIPVPEGIGQLLNVNTLVADAYWSDCGVALEYDGEDYHSSGAQRSYDNIRRSILRRLGIDVITVDKRQMMDMAVLDGVMQIVSDAVGGPPIRQDAVSRNARLELRSQLLAPDIDLYRVHAMQWRAP